MLAQFREASPIKFDGYAKLWRRFDELRQRILRSGLADFANLHEPHNEICAACAILSRKDWSKTELAYESRERDEVGPIDFRVTLQSGQVRYVEVKTVLPHIESDWGGYLQAKSKERFSSNCDLILDRDFGGGEQYHLMRATRTKFIEHALSFEKKIEVFAKNGVKARYTLLFCGEGFHWDYMELEDFVAQYRFGKPRYDDTFGTMQTHYLEWDLRRAFSRKINSFGVMTRPQYALAPTKVKWRLSPSWPL